MIGTTSSGISDHMREMPQNKRGRNLKWTIPLCVHCWWHRSENTNSFSQLPWHATHKLKNKLLKHLDHSKTTGPDEIPTGILKEYAHEFFPHLASFYNISLSRGEVPSDWSQANVIPVFKKGEKYIASIYRPVSLTCICCNVLEHIVVSNMMKHLEIHDILVDCQHGFRAKRSCETQLISLTHELLNNLHSGIQNDLIILDFSKAFDKVPHKKLLCKQDSYLIRDTTLKWIGSFLSNRMQQVVLDGE